MTNNEDYKSVVQIIKERLEECGLENKPKGGLETREE